LQIFDSLYEESAKDRSGQSTVEKEDRGNVSSQERQDMKNDAEITTKPLNVFYPYISLRQMDELNNKKGYFVGTSNMLFTRSNSTLDVVINVCRFLSLSFNNVMYICKQSYI
jgi:hypothetical protein